MLPAPDLPKEFDLIERGGISWVETRKSGYLILFSLSSASARPEPLDIGRTVGAPSSGQLKARRELSKAIGIDPGRIRLARQVHGDEILDLDGPDVDSAAALLDTEPPRREADGFFLPAGDPGLDGAVPAIVTADCLPIAIIGPEGAALLHLGWRGLATGMLERAVEKTRGLEAVIGPAIGPCCYEVGPEVFEALGSAGVTKPGPLDLPAIAARRLSAAGVENVQWIGLCTCCRQELLFSHRRDGENAGRQVSLLVG